MCSARTEPVRFVASAWIALDGLGHTIYVADPPHRQVDAARCKPPAAKPALTYVTVMCSVSAVCNSPCGFVSS